MNGCSTAIGTGWSCTIPPHHPFEVMEYIRTWIGEKEKTNSLSTPFSLKPYYRNFQGQISPSGVETKFLLTGKVVPYDPTSVTITTSSSLTPTKPKSGKKKKNAIDVVIENVSENISEHQPSHPPIPSLKGVRNTSRIYVVTEIPVSCSLHRYKEYLDTLVEKKKIKKYENHSTSNEPLFVIFLLSSLEEATGGGEESKTEKNEGLTGKEMEMFKLSETVSEENMVVLVHPSNVDSQTLKSTKVYKLSKFELLDKYCVRRLELYEKRKERMMESLRYQISVWKEKIRFLEEIVLTEKENKNFWKIEENEMVSYLTKKNFIVFGEDTHYRYLTDIPIKHCTLKQKEKWEKEKNDWEKEYDQLQQKQSHELWLDDLRDLEIHLKKMYPELIR